MKRMAAVMMLAMAVATLAHAQTSSSVKDDLFNGTEMFAKGASDVTEVTMDPDSLGMVGGSYKDRARTMVLNVVRTYEYDKPGMYNIADVEVFRNKLNTGDWHCSVHTRSSRNNESTDVCNKRRTDDMVETAIITVEPKELTFIHTIRKRSSHESGAAMGPMGPGESLMALPDMSTMGTEMQARMQAQIAITRAQMGAMAARMKAEGMIQSAEIAPQMSMRLGDMHLDDTIRLKLDVLKDLHPLDDKEIQQLKDSVRKSLDSTKQMNRERDRDKDRDENHDKQPE